MEDLAGQHAFVTGGASGIGLAIAEALLAQGARVSVGDFDAERLASLPAGLAGLALDVRDRAQWASAKAAAEARFGPVGILVNNAGIGPDGKDLADMDPAAFERLIAIKLIGTFNGISAFGGGMRELGSGHIVNTASMAGLMAIPHLGAYTASKFAVVGMSESLRSEMAPYGVGVSVLCPGLVATNLRETTIRVGSAVTETLNPVQRNGLDPARVGARVVAGIKGNWPYILTHGEDRGPVEKRMNRLMAAFADTPPSADL